MKIGFEDLELIDWETGLPMAHPLSGQDGPTSVKYRIAQNFRAKLKDYLSGEDSKTKSAVRCFFGIGEERIMDCVEMITDSISEYVSTLKKRELFVAKLEQKRISMESQIVELKSEVESLQKERDSLAERFSDQRARDAYILYKEACKPDGEEDAYTKQRRVTAAGLMAAAFLGLKEYNIKPNK